LQGQCLYSNYLGHELSSVRFHPDGLLFGLVSSKSVEIFSIEDNKPIMNLDSSSSSTDLEGISFSENGYNMLSYTRNDAKLWDLRKQDAITTFNYNTSIRNGRFDYSGALISICGDRLLRIIHNKTGLDYSIQCEEKICDFQINSAEEQIVADINGRLYKLST
jgi:hypothetical protein